MQDSLIWVAFSSLAAVYAVDKFLTGLKSRGIDLMKMSKQVEDVWQWCSREDENGVKLWYRRRSFEESVEKLAGAVEEQSRLLQEAVLLLRGLREDMERLSAEITKIRS